MAITSNSSTNHTFNLEGRNFRGKDQESAKKKNCASSQVQHLRTFEDIWALPPWPGILIGLMQKKNSIPDVSRWNWNVLNETKAHTTYTHMHTHTRTHIHTHTDRQTHTHTHAHTHTCTLWHTHTQDGKTQRNVTNVSSIMQIFEYFISCTMVRISVW